MGPGLPEGAETVRKDTEKPSFFVRLATVIVDKRKLIFFLYACALLFCLFSRNWVSVCNDITEYLPDSTETRQGLTLMEEEFTTFGTARVMVSHVTYDIAEDLAEQIGEIEGVTSATLGESTGGAEEDSAQTPEEIDPNTTARVPVFLSEDCRYFQDVHQGMPLEGYTPLFQRMLDHPNITVELNTDAAARIRLEDGRVYLDGAPFAGTVIYTGAADELFGCRYGRLPYRTLDFVFETHPVDFWQSHGTVNYTVDQDYTRITEFKYLTGQELPGATTIAREYSRSYTGEAVQVPYYAIINPENNALYARYAAEAERYPDFHLLGRLAEYKYYNMDAIAARALELCDDLLK